MEEFLLDRPRWLDWGWALAVVAAEVRLPGELVVVAEGSIATPLLLEDRPSMVTVRATGDKLAVAPSTAPVAATVTSRFHLDLDEVAVSAALESSRLLDPAAWVRRPAAAELWAYCLTFLCGGDPDAPAVRRLFEELGAAGAASLVAPEPEDLLRAGERPLLAAGIAPHRAANVLGLARAFTSRPDRYDEDTLRALPPGEAIARLASLPHIGKTRATAIAGGALGHDDVLADLARYGEQLRGVFGISWSQVRAAAGRAAPYRSVLSDTLLERLSA